METSQAAADQGKLLQQAQDEFSRKNYANCLSLLDTIKAYEGLPERLKHNKLVAEFYKNDLRSVNEILRKFEEIVGESPPRPELAYLHYNYALILYHKRQLKKALKVLKPLQRVIKSTPQDEVLSAHTFLLTMAILCELDHKQGSGVLAQVASADGQKRYFSMDPNLFEENGTQWDFKDMWQLIAHRVDVLGKAEVKLNMKLDSSEYCVLRAHQHFLKHDIQMAAKELSKKFHNVPFTVEKNGDSQDTVLANNMGLIHFSVRHYAMAVRFFQYALNFDHPASENCLKNPALVEMSASRRPHILYNLGISMLHLERPQEAFDCLLVPLNYHHNNPRLWLRVAEACIMMHRINVKNETNHNLLTCGAIGNGMLRKFILKSSAKKYKIDHSENYAIPNPNLEFATLCLNNALMLVRHIEGTVRDKDRTVPSMPSNPMKRQMMDKLKWTILSNLSYSHIYLGDFTSALKYGMELLEEKEVATSFTILANMYCAEALMMMDKAQQVLPYLSATQFSDCNPQDLENHTSPAWQRNGSFELLKATFQYNASLSLMMMNSLNQAGVLLTKCNPEILDHIMKLKVYLDLSCGNVDLPRNLALIEDKCLV